MLLFEMKKKFFNYIEVYRSCETVSFYHDHLDVIIEYIGNIDSDDLSIKHLESFIKSQKNKVCNGTINKRLTALKTMFNYCKIINSDLFYMKNLKYSQNSFNCINGKNLKELLNYVNNRINNIEHKLIIFLFLETGIRLNEIVNILIENIDFDERVIKLVNTKNKKIRYVCYGELTAKYICDFKLNKGYLIKLKKSGIQSLMRRLSNNIGFKIHSHMFRHTYASILNVNDSNLYYIMQGLGHSSLDMTKKYIHSDYNLQKKKYDKFFKIENYI